MLKIEVIKFEAQDVITASTVPMIPLKPATPTFDANCICQQGLVHVPGDPCEILPPNSGEFVKCPAQKHDHR